MRFTDQPPSYQHLEALRKQDQTAASIHENACIDCGWGRVLMGHTFKRPQDIADQLLQESPGKRDIAMYVADPHVVLAAAPQTLFLDPSDSYRLDLEKRLADASMAPTITVCQVSTIEQARGVNELYLKRDMVPTDPEYIWAQRDSDQITWLVAIDKATDAVVGTVMGINHITLFNDPSRGSSLWCLAVDPQANQPGIGELLLRNLADHFLDQGCSYMDLSVLHDNAQAKTLYEKLGFRQIHTFAIKNKNAYNETLFLGPELEEKLNPYARILVDEARSRGISVDILDAQEGYFRLSRGSTQIDCRESLSELTSAVAMSRCQDKLVTHRWLQRAGLRTPSYKLAGRPDANVAFLEEHRRIVVKPAVGEQGAGITVGVDSPAALETAVSHAASHHHRVLLESYHPGEDLRVVVIGYKVVAAAVRRPPEVLGDGKLSIEQLIEKLSRRRQASSGGECSIPIDNDTIACLAEQDLTPASVIDQGRSVKVRRTANFHTGGTIHDVTGQLHPALASAAEQAAKHLKIPVVGLDFMVADPALPDYVIIEANERVGLANHEPQPTAQRFVDLLFPLSTSVHDTRRPGGSNSE
ncbi:MAG: N-acetylglutaminylglutamine synthetase [Halieaceae bacterium]|jgi:GNAT-family acetyltransferase (TIGR03103 family)|nr:N-acetylglutaminylglutamine synthetase [Halieaceae bacterium]